jgi:uncharacterized protein with PIN domain/sulfur carrier protein ThiS
MSEGEPAQHGSDVRLDVRFFGELNRLVAPGRRNRYSSASVHLGTTVKDLVESLGVPHTEVDVIVIGGSSVAFDERVHEGDRVEVRPTSEGVEVEPVIHLRPDLATTPRFLLDVHLGRLARYLRLLGFDAEWGREATDEELARSSAQDNRVLLTRDRGILKRAGVTHGYLVRESVPRRQIDEVLSRFGLNGPFHPFGRCLACNGRLQDVDKEEVLHLLPPRTRRDYQHFRRCGSCGRIFWKGSHYDRLEAQLQDIERSLRTRGPGPRPRDR